MGKSRISKRSKKGWKQYDTESVKHAISEIRDADRNAKGVAAAKDADLFVVDATPQTDSLSGLSEKKKKNWEQLEEKGLPKPNHIKVLMPPKEKVENYNDIRKRKNPNDKPAHIPPLVTSKPTVNLDIWGGEDLKKAQSNTPKRGIKLIHAPHPGQSYNPDSTDHQEAISEARKREMYVVKEANKILAYLSSGKREMEKPGGDDVKDGRKAQKVEGTDDQTLEVPAVKIGKPKLKKLSATDEKKKGIQRHKGQMRRNMLKIKGKVDIDKVVQEITGPSKTSIRKANKIKREAAKKKIHPNHIGGAEDVMLTDELPENLRKMENNSTALWMETVRSLKDSDLFMKRDQNKLKAYYQNGVPVKTKL